jgi:F-type H+-transporting ATPase subunit b
MATEHQGTVETTETPKHESSGLPQLQFEHWGGQIVWLLLIFAVLFAVLSKVLLPRVSGAIETRGAKIAGDIADARRLKDEAEVQARAAAAEVAEARAKAQKTAADAKAKASAEAAERQAKEEAVLAEKLSDRRSSHPGRPRRGHGPRPCGGLGDGQRHRREADGQGGFGRRAQGLVGLGKR